MENKHKKKGKGVLNKTWSGNNENEESDKY
jgi:hypothetical protein